MQRATLFQVLPFVFLVSQFALAMSPENFSESMGDLDPSEVIEASKLTTTSSTAGLGAHIMHGLGAASSPELSVASSPAGDPSNTMSLNAIIHTSLNLITVGNLSSAFTCGLSYQAYDSFTSSWNSVFVNWTTYTTELLTVTVVQGTGTVYTTVDGIPRASGIFTPTATSVFNTATISSSVSLGPRPPPPLNASAPLSPTCSLGVSECRALYSSYFSSLGINPNATIVPSITPVPTNSPPCGAFVLQRNGACSSSSNSRQTPGSCTLYGQNVQLFFFPPATQQSNGTTTNMVVQAFAPGVTFTSPSVYLSFDALWATSTMFGDEDRLCTTYSDGINIITTVVDGGVAYASAGTTHRNVLLTLEPEDVSSVVVNLPESQTASVISALASGGSDYSYWASQISSALYNEDYANQRITLTDLIHPPNSAYYFQGLGRPGCDFAPAWDDLADTPTPVLIRPECQTVFEGLYKAQLSLPSQLLSIDPAWSTCYPNIQGVYDPPHILTKGSTAAVPAGPTPSGSFVPHPPPAPSGRPAAPTPDPTPSINSDPMGPTIISGERGGSSSSQSIVSPWPSPGASQGRDPKLASTDEPGLQPGPSASYTVSLDDLRPSDSRIAGSVLASKGSGVSGAVKPVASQDGISGAVVSFDPMIASIVSGSADQEVGDTDPGGGGVVAGSDSGSTADNNRYGTSDNKALGSSQEVAVDIGGHLITAVSHTDAAIVDGHTLKIGDSDVMVDGHTVSAADKGILVDGSMVLYSPVVSSAPGTARTAGVKIDGIQYTAASQNGAVLIGSKTVSVGGAPAIIGGHIVSAAVKGVVVTLTVGGKPVTASEENGAFVISGSTLHVGSSPVTINGAAISLGSSGVVVGANSLPFEALGLAPLTADELKSGQTTVKTGSSSYQISEAPNGQYVVLDGSITLSAGGPATMIDGQMVSAYPGGVKIGSSFTNHGASVFTEDGHIFTVSPEADDANIMVVDGSISLTVDGAASIVDGEKLSAVSGGVVAGSFTVSLDTGSTMAVDPGISSSTVSPQVSSPGEGTSPFSGAKRIIGSLFAALFCSCIGTVLAAVF
ncbi:hypothetical protein EV356DRAFT_499513 [Viridothelium virens]|uniref:Uncharacterized protein n=1 Tax=Viridothelium virens TaxID=1048519 RepID=A0A6A6HCS8_VIRVR|nr:hypothetical protein EV356DRAFT_499513 [Viridothelium virens]